METIASILLVGLVLTVFILMAITPLVAEHLEQTSVINPLDRLDRVEARDTGMSHQAAQWSG